MNCAYLANFGADSVEVNGQVTKSVHFKAILDLTFTDIITFNSYGLNVYQMLVFLACKERYKFISLGSKGMFLFILLSTLFSTKNEKIFCVVVGGWMPKFLSKWYVKIVRAFCSVDFVFLAETNGLCSELVELGEESHHFSNFRSVPTITPFKFDSVSEENRPVRFIFLSRLIPSKGVEVCINAVNYINRDANLCTLDIYGVGDNTYIDIIKNLVTSSEAITYKGSVQHEDVQRTLSEYDALLLPSNYQGECMPGVVIEALAAGTLSITSDHRFLPEIISHLGYGYSLPLDSFHEDLNRLIVDGMVRTKTKDLSDLLYKRFQSEFSLDRGAERLKEILLC